MTNETKLQCPHCKRIATVYHMNWVALGCGRFIEGKVKDGCGAMVDKKDWKQQQKGKTKMKIVTEQELKQLNEAMNIGMKWFMEMKISVPEEEHRKFDDAHCKLFEIINQREDA